MDSARIPSMNADGAFSDPKDVNSTMWFLERDELYASVKPYTLAFTPDSDIPRDNIRREEKKKVILDIRARIDQLKFEHNGFTILELAEHPESAEWDDKKWVEKECYPAVIAGVKKAFPGASCLPLHHQIRKRDTSFPISTGKDYTHGQPLVGAHIDTVRSSAEQLVQERLGGTAKSILSKRYMIANVWRPLHGPNDDYPLALCDLETIDQKRDLEVADYVSPTMNREHCLVYSNDNHRWWYLSQQKTTEALIFLQYDSEKEVASGVPHAAFMNPHSRQIRPRESIEIPMLIWWE